MSTLHIHIGLLLVASALSYAGCALNATKIGKVLKKLDQRNFILAPREKGEQINVSLAFNILNMVPLSFINNHIFVEMDISTIWKDKHLTYEAESPNDVIVLQSSQNLTIWRPDIVVIHEKGIEEKTFPGNLATCRISPHGDVIYSQRVSITVYCPMRLASFPFDKQSCPLSFESYAYNTSQLRLKFYNISGMSAVRFSSSFKISKFLLEKYTFETSVTDYGISGFFDQLRINFFLKRDIRFYVMEYYFPIICAVFLSFISFWIAHESTPARVALPVTTFLTLTAMLDHVRMSSGFFGTADALEIFLNVSVFFIFGVMVEYGLLEAAVTESKKNIESSKEDIEGTARKKGQHSSLIRQVLKRVKAYWKRTSVRSSDGTIFLDQICRYVFPLSYSGFLILYFVISIVNLNNG